VEGVSDKEMKYRHRYLDLICDDRSKQRFIMRSLIIAMIRSMLANRRFIEERIPHLSSLLVEDTATLIADVDVVVVGYQSPEFVAAVQQLRPDQTVVDLVRLAKEVQTPAKYVGICW